MSNISFFFAFFAGLASFLSPCVLPLLPGFLGFLAGSTDIKSKSSRLEIFLTSVFFVLGFSVVFSLLGVLLNTVLESTSYSVQAWLSRIGGAFIIIFGLHLTTLIRLPILNKEYKLIKINRKFKSRYLTSFLFGTAFAVGWTPCVGAVLGGILVLAATQPGSAFNLLFIYTLGLGIPFLILGLFVSQANNLIRKYAFWLGKIQIAFGYVMIILGILVFTQNLNLLANFAILNSLLLAE